MSQYNVSLHDGSNAPLAAFTPAAGMAYTDIQTLRGLDKPADYGSGVEYADGMLNSLFPGEQVGLQLGLWLNGTHGCEQINQGLLDDNIVKLTHYLKRSSATRVFLRIGYEFDNPSFGHSDGPEAYVAAYRRIAKACKQTCQEKVLLVWHSWAAPLAEGLKLDDFYPGDDVVDWIGVSVFQQFYPWSVSDGQVRDVERVLDFAEQHNKPTMIAESTPFGGIDMNTPQVQQNNLTDPWERWFQPTLDLIEKYDISMWSYINCDWQSQPMWQETGFGETRLVTNDHVMDQWRRHVLGGGRHDERKFLMAGSLVQCGKNGNNQFRAISFESARGLVEPGKSKEGQMPSMNEIPTHYLIVLVTGLFVSVAVLMAWHRRQRKWETHETVSLQKRHSLGYGSLDFIESFPSTIPMYNAEVRLRESCVRWHDPLDD